MKHIDFRNRNHFCLKCCSGMIIVLFLLMAINSKELNAQVAGYSFNQFPGTYNPLSPARTIVFTATANASSDPGRGDDINFPQSLPFPFTFDGTVYNNLVINTNGFISFGTAPATNTYSPISGTGGYSGCIVSRGGDLSANTDPANLGEISIEVLGSGNNRIYTIQYAKYRRFSTSSTFTENYNFQIKLYEGGGNPLAQLIETVYGACVSTSTTATCQVGLRGPNNVFASGNVNNRQNPASGWNASQPGVANNSVMRHTTTVSPALGQTYQWIPPIPPACPAPSALSATNITSSSATLNWNCASCTGLFRVEYNVTPATFGNPGNVVIDPATSPLPIGPLLPNTGYTFFVRQDCGVDGFSTVSSLSFVTSQPGESCTDAPQMIPVYSDSASAINTTLSTGQSQDGPDGDCSNGTGNPAKKDRWVQFVAPSNGNKLVLQTTAGSLTDAIMQVWTDCPGSGSAIACVDDVPGSNMPTISLCQYQYIPGQLYYARIWPFSTTASGIYGLKIYEATSCPVPPANDNCDNPIHLNVYPALFCPGAELIGTTVNATTSVGLSNASCDQFGIYNDVFYSFNSGPSTTLNLSFANLTGTSRIALYSACSGSAISCFSAGTQSLTGLLQNTLYILRVWSNPGSEGDFSLCLSTPPVPDCVPSPIYPPDGAIDIDPCNLVLSWPSVPGATGYDVYFDTGGGPPVTLVSSNQPGTTFPIVDFLTEEQCTFFAIPRNESGPAVGCSYFSFTTAAGSPLPCYCPSTHSSGCGSGDEMQTVTLHTLSSFSSCASGAYTFDPSATTSLNPGSSYILTVTFGNDGNQYFGAWVDFNRDGVFSTFEFLGASGNAGSNGSAFITFTVPDTARQLLTRLRVVGGNDSPVPATGFCGSSGSSFGETEDFDITIADVEPPLISNCNDIVAYTNQSGGSVNVTYPVSATDNAPVEGVACNTNGTPFEFCIDHSCSGLGGNCIQVDYDNTGDFDFCACRINSRYQNDVTATPPSGSLFSTGTHPVFVTATDQSGLTSNCSFNVTVLDTFPPPPPVNVWSIERINYVSPEIMVLSPYIAVNFNYLNTGTLNWHLNLVALDYRTNNRFWLGRNIPLPPFPSTRDLVFEPNLASLINLQPGDTMSQLGLVVFVTDTTWNSVILSPLPAYVSYPLIPVVYDVPTDPKPTDTTRVTLPTVTIPPNTVTTTDTSKNVTRGCDVPNVPLDSSKNNPSTVPGYAGDCNVCGPASAANSMEWLEARHPGLIASGLNLRDKLKELSAAMNRANNQGVSDADFIKGKLAFIDKYKLPIHVKYTYHDKVISDSSISSPHSPSYGHKAENKSNNIGTGKNNIDPEWVYSEMKAGEDVEMSTTSQRYVKNPDGSYTPKNIGGHLVVLTGISVVKGVVTVDYKDDIRQKDSTGTRERTGVRIDTVNGRMCIDIWEYANGDLHVTWIDGFVSESYDPSITFPPVADAGPDKSIHSGQSAGMQGSFGGNATTATWSTNGTGQFVPSVTDLNASYIPSAQDILSGSVILTLTTDANPGYIPASDQLLLTILPPLANTVVNSVHRINYVQPFSMPLYPFLAIQYNYTNTDSFPYFFNLMGLDFTTDTEVWVAQNLPLNPFPGTRDLVYEANMAKLLNLQPGDSLNSIGLKIFVTDTVWFNPVQSPPEAYQDFQIPNLEYNVPTLPPKIDSTVTFSNFTYPLPYFSRTDTIRGVTRGCEVPNVPLDSSKNNNGTDSTYAGDHNACGPASAANSMEWLEAKHPEIVSNLNLREKLKALSAAMNRTANSGVSDIDFIKGKLAFIDKYKLPIHVKYAYYDRVLSDSSISSPHTPSYGHKAENKSKNIGTHKNNIDFNWIYSEMEAGEDVEMATSTLRYVKNPDGSYTATPESGHLVVITGAHEVKGVRSVDYKDDISQADSTGTRERTGVALDTINGRMYFDIWTDTTNGNIIVTWVDGFVSESYDPSITFPPVADAGPDKTIPSGQSADLQGSFGGNATTATWTTSGTGVFKPAFFDVFVNYIPSAQDIINGSVVLTLTTDALPGYTPASDQMTLTISPPPANVHVHSIERINFVYPRVMSLSPYLAVNFNYHNTDTFTHFMNLMALDYRTNTQFWLGQNIPLDPFPGTRDLTFEPNLNRLINLQPGEPMSQLGLRLIVTDSVWYQPLIDSSLFYWPYPLPPVVYDVPTDPKPEDTTTVILPVIPPNTFAETDTTKSVTRGCEVPNVPLDSSKNYPGSSPGYAGDFNACGPASAANSMEWLEGRHAGLISSGIDLREKLKELSKAMNRQNNKGVSDSAFISGKLAFIDKYKLPIHVKYAYHDRVVGDSSIASPHTPSHGHKAENKSKNIGTHKNNIDMEWVFEEMKKGEDVEMSTTTKYYTKNPDGTYTSSTIGGHLAVVTGINVVKGVVSVTTKDDVRQRDSTGTIEHPATKIDTMAGRSYIDRIDYANGDVEITWIDGFVSESYDSTITFPPVANAGPDQTILAGQTAHLQGSIGGFTSGAAWTTSGSGSFVPSFFDVFTDYIPSAADITAGSVLLTLTANPLTGYSPAQDQMVLTISSGVTLNLKVFIEGLYIGGQMMNSFLYDKSLSLDPTATDSITIDLWSPMNLSVPAYTTSGIVHNNGHSTITYPIDVLNQSYYIVVRYRNALETWSKDPVLFGSTTVSFDFTSP